jgi:hypothetical protein
MFIGIISCDDVGDVNTIIPIQTKIEKCTTTKVTGGYTIKCGDSESIFLTNGEDGDNGEDAIIEVIHPCNNNEGETLLRLSDGTLIVYFKDVLGCKEYLKVLTSGEYTTTDGNYCKYTVLDTGEIIW